MSQSQGASTHNDVAVGVLMIVAAAATVVAMAHHPTGAHAAGPMGELVHGLMIVLLGVLFVGFAYFALRRDIRRPVVLAGLVAYGVSLGAHIGAATINGVVVPALAARGPGEVGHEVFLLCWELNQALAALGVVATGAAFTLWSLDFLRRGGGIDSAVGGIGLAAGVLPAAALLSGRATMTLATAFVVYAAHALWSMLVGLQLALRRI